MKNKEVKALRMPLKLQFLQPETVTALEMVTVPGMEQETEMAQVKVQRVNHQRPLMIS